eukprot:3139657-Prymnesium_polylepis.1
MPAVGRLQCGACSVIYRSVYRGRRPLCKRCRSAHTSVDAGSLAAAITRYRHHIMSHVFWPVAGGRAAQSGSTPLDELHAC